MKFYTKSDRIYKLTIEEEVLQPVKQAPLNTLVIAVYHCLGSTTYASQHPEEAIDLEVDLYKYKVDKSPNPEYPGNYISMLKFHLVNNRWKYIFIGTHLEILDELIKQGIGVTILYPAIERKQELLELCKKRGNNAKFLSTLESNFESYIGKLATYKRSYSLGPGEFISDELFNNKLTFLKR